MTKRGGRIRLLAGLVVITAGAGCGVLPPPAWSPSQGTASSMAFAQSGRHAPRGERQQIPGSGIRDSQVPSAPHAEREGYIAQARPLAGSSQVVRGQAGTATYPAPTYSNSATPGSQAHWRYPMPASGVGGAAPAQLYNGAIYGAPPQTVYAQPGAVAPLPPPQVISPLPAPQTITPLPAPQPGNVILAPGDLPYVPPSAIAPGGVLPPPEPFADIDVIVDETRTGRFMFGVGINSDAGVTAQITVDERNFDITRPPTSFEDVLNGTAWRGAGQGFRFEAMPGSQLQRYLVSFTEPYLFDTPISFSTSGYYYNRRYFDWTETRAGGRMGLGYRITPDLSLSTSVRAEAVEIEDPRVLGVPELDRVLGSTDLFTGRVSLTQDTRDSPFAATEGHFLELAYEQGFGSFDYPRGEFDYRQYFLLRERPDGSGRHTLSYNFRLGFSGSQTPLYEHYFAGGYSTLRGFNFRGASPMDMGVTVGGNFQMLNSIEYLFPLTADDMLKGVVFTDFGTVEEDIELNAENYRIAPGFGLRIFVPAMGPAPIALDFAFPVAMADTDRERMFSFFIGFGR